MFSFKPLHLLIADDDQEDKDIFTVAVREVSPSIILESAKSCEALIDKLENSNTLPDIIFLDLNMPKMGGHTCLQKLKQSGRYSQIPVIIYTTSSAREDIERTFMNGAAYFLTKPVDIAELKEALRYLLQNSFKETNRGLENYVLEHSPFSNISS